MVIQGSGGSRDESNGRELRPRTPALGKQTGNVRLIGEDGWQVRG